MPIKLNGTTIIDESTLADTSLSNLTSAGSDVISSIASSAVAGSNYMKCVNTKNPISVTISAGTQGLWTAPNNGWVLFSSSNTGLKMGSQYGTGVSLQAYTAAGCAFPICKDTVFFLENSGSSVFYFFEEL